MSKRVIEKPEHIIIYKIVEHYEYIKRKDIIELGKKIWSDLLGKEVSEGAIINHIREITRSKDKRSKDLAVIESRSGGMYKIIDGVEVTPENKNVWNEVDKFLKLKIENERVRTENKIISMELRVSHTQKIRERVILPWIELEDIYARERREYCERYGVESISDIKKDPLFKDLDNHIPPDLENPKKVYEKVKKREKELQTYSKNLREKFERTVFKLIEDENLKIAKVNKNLRPLGTGWIVHSISGLLFKWITRVKESEFEEILSYLERTMYEGLKHMQIQPFAPEPGGKSLTGVYIERLVYCDEEVSEGEMKKRAESLFLKIIRSDKTMELIKNTKELVEREKEIEKLKIRMVEILKDLENYEILPGPCKYISFRD